MQQHPKRRAILGLDVDLLTLVVIFFTALGLMWLLVSCALYEAVVGTVESGGEAAEAAAAAAVQTESTLAALEEVLVYGGIYLAGELRRPLVGLGKKGVQRCKDAMANHKRNHGAAGD